MLAGRSHHPQSPHRGGNAPNPPGRSRGAKQPAADVPIFVLFGRTRRGVGGAFGHGLAGTRAGTISAGSNGKKSVGLGYAGKTQVRAMLFNCRITKSARPQKGRRPRKATTGRRDFD